MATQDISRFLLQPEKHYSNLHLQQGRVVVDSDWNERAAIAAEDFRQAVLDIACSHGTPNDGFEVAVHDPGVATEMPTGPDHDTYDLQIHNGSYYVGGMRFVVDLNPGFEEFLSQADWLQINSLADNMPAAVPINDVNRNDLIYVYSWEQPVTAVEDAELREVALGGRDTSVRIKRMRRIMVKTDVASTDCDIAFPELITDLNSSGKASYDSATGELLSAGRLTVSTNSSGVPEDLCAEQTTAGYVGAHNQTIRVELRDDGVVSGFVWGLDNASPLYRVKVDGDRLTVTFLTEPTDAAALPLAGQVVEILEWGAKLPNEEKVAEAQGFLTTVATTYDPLSKELTLSEEIPDGWLQWLALHTEHHSDRDVADEQQYLYLRVWDRGADITSTPIIECGEGQTKDLGSTGLSVTLDSEGKPGDYWIIAARPSTPDVVTPWNLDDSVTGGVAPHGPRRFYAPLATIFWESALVSVSSTVYDCRTKLRRLCEGGCCTVTVGDGKVSHGQVSSLQDAVDMVKTGGKICILPGEYEDNAVLFECTDVTIEGCGSRTIIRNPTPTAANSNFIAFDQAVFKVEDCTGVVIKDLAIVPYSAVGVEVAEGDGECKQVRLENLTIVADGGIVRNDAGQVTSWRLPAPAVTVAAATEVELVDCHISFADMLSFSFGVVLGGETISMRGCSVTAPSDADIAPSYGGVNIRSCSRDVEIIGCDINGGRGNGIALGHGRYYLDDVGHVDRESVLKEAVTVGVSETAVTDENGQPDPCPCDEDDDEVAPEDPPANKTYLPAGPIEDLRIYDNRIRNMGKSGISTTFFWSSIKSYEGGKNVPRFIVVNDADIARNIIEDNCRINSRAQPFRHFDRARGGVVLAASVNAWIHENTIRNNGKHPRVPICGVGMLASMNAVIEDNQIVDNSVELPEDSDPVIRGLRGGIAVWEATKLRTRVKTDDAPQEMPAFPTSTPGEIPPEPVKDWAGASSQAAVTVRGNEVSHLLGKALWVRRGFGPLIVTGNSLVSYGTPAVNEELENVALRWAPVGADSIQLEASCATVELVNLAHAVDVTPGTEVPMLAWTDDTPATVEGGALLFSNNNVDGTWRWRGGVGCGVLLSSLDTCVVTNNVSRMTTGNPFGEGLEISMEQASKPTKSLLKQVADAAVQMAWMMVHIYVGAGSSAQVSGNRIVDGSVDVLFSAWICSVLSPSSEDFSEIEDAMIYTDNVTTHCPVTSFLGAAVEVNNVAILQNEDVSGCLYDLAQASEGNVKVIVASGAL